MSVLELELPAPGQGWAAHLADRGISITIDDIGRAAVSRSDARRLFDEKREREAQVREHAAVVERQAIEADRQWRAALAGGTLPMQFLTASRRLLRCCRLRMMLSRAGRRCWRSRCRTRKR